MSGMEIAAIVFLTPPILIATGLVIGCAGKLLDVAGTTTIQAGALCCLCESAVCCCPCITAYCCTHPEAIDGSGRILEDLADDINVAANYHREVSLAEVPVSRFHNTKLAMRALVADQEEKLRKARSAETPVAAPNNAAGNVDQQSTTSRVPFHHPPSSPYNTHSAAAVVPAAHETTFNGSAFNGATTTFGIAPEASFHATYGATLRDHHPYDSIVMMPGTAFNAVSGTVHDVAHNDNFAAHNETWNHSTAHQPTLAAFRDVSSTMNVGNYTRDNGRGDGGANNGSASNGGANNMQSTSAW